MNSREIYEPFLNKNEFYMLSEVESLYGDAYGVICKNSLIIKDEIIFENYNKADLFTLSNGKKVSKELIHDLLSENGMYKYLQTNLINTLGIMVRVDYILNKENIISIKITGSELLEALEKMFELEELNQKEMMRKALIENSLKIYSFKKTYQNQIHGVFIENKYINFNVDLFIKILCEEETFNLFVSQGYSDEYYKVFPKKYKKEEIAYGLVDFIERNRIFTRYGIAEEVKKRFEKIRNYSEIDFEYINKNRRTNDENEDQISILDTFDINENLRREIFKYTNSEYSDLEKAIYTYLRLCEILTYDKEYYLTNKTKDSNIENIDNITSDNNEVSSYSFILIYAKLLKEMGLSYTLDQNLLSGLERGFKKLTFRVGEYLVFLDSVGDITTSDLTNVKINDDLLNLSVMNRNSATRNKFKETVEKVYKDIIERREEKQKFKTAVLKYQDKYETYKLSSREKLYLLLKEISRPNLKGVDVISYHRKIFNNLFYGNNNIELTFVCSLEDSNKKSALTPVSIISIYNNGKYLYLVIDSNNQNNIRKMNKNQLNDLFEKSKYFYINSTETIPGMIMEEGKVYARRIKN